MTADLIVETWQSEPLMLGSETWTATFSPCKKYRYQLTRRWGAAPLLHYCCLNPSTADASKNDPTVERLYQRAIRGGYGGLIVTNAFAWRETDRKAMMRVAEPIGADCDRLIIASALQAGMTVLGWGNEGRHRSRGVAVRKLLSDAGVKCHYLKLTKFGEPYHPLYVGYAVEPQPFTSP